MINDARESHFNAFPAMFAQLSVLVTSLALPLHLLHVNT